MGTWDQAALPSNFGLEEALLKKMSLSEIEYHWRKIGTPDIAEYSLVLYGDTQNGGWKRIDDSTTFKSFKLFFDTMYPDEHARMLACVLAHRIGHPKTVERSNEEGTDDTARY